MKLLFLRCQTADAKMLVKCLQINFVPMFTSIAYKIVPRPRFVRVLDCDRILVVRALNCARLCVVCALNCARILVVRAISLAPCPFANLEHWSSLLL